MKVPYEQARGTIRFSLSRYNRSEDVDQTLAALDRIIPA
jgi:cysteine sulfinate desulfinase/cysteine desulfurase-like protein